MDLTNDELVTLIHSLNAWAVGQLHRASYNWHAADLNYVLSGGANGYVEQAKALIAKLEAELERRKDEQCEPASK